MDEPTLDPTIRDHYSDRYDEDERIRSGIAELELIRTRDILRRHLPVRASVLDVGGAGGVHSEWLLEDGHDVTLVDPVPRHIDEASARLGGHERFRAMLGDGRALPVEDDAVDVVLVFGPLYHLIERSDRMRAWSEARRVCRRGGLIFGAAISRFASLFSGMAGGMIFDDQFRQVVEQDLRDGRHENPRPDRDWFTTAYFHHPDELREEASEAGVEVDAVLGVEGIAAWIPRLERSWSDPVQRNIIVEAAAWIEAEATLSGLGPHLLVVCRNPT